MTLADELYAAESNRADARWRVEALLHALFPDGWRGWEFNRLDLTGASIDVYSVRGDADTAVESLRANGFRRVTLHPHRIEALLTCECEAEP